MCGIVGEMHRLPVLVLVIAACGSSKPRSDGEPYPVGVTIGGELLNGPTRCTYEAPASVARLTLGNTAAELVGEGQITKVCGASRSTHDVIEPTGIRIDGPSKIKAGATDNVTYRAQLVAGERDLHGITSGNARPTWFHGKDCDGIAAFGPVQASREASVAAITRDLVTTAAGTCTLHVELLGRRGSLAVTIE